MKLDVLSEREKLFGSAAAKAHKAKCAAADRLERRPRPGWLVSAQENLSSPNIVPDLLLGLASPVHHSCCVRHRSFIPLLHIN